MSKHNPTPLKEHVLRHLSASTGPLTLVQLTEQLDDKPARVAFYLQGLKMAGLVTSTGAPGTRHAGRVLLWSVTDRGRQQIKTLDAERAASRTPDSEPLSVAAGLALLTRGPRR